MDCFGDLPLPISPKIRCGKWSFEEELYVAKITEYFEKGLLPIPSGTSLRALLSKVLMCDPMRLTKKCSRTNKSSIFCKTKSFNPALPTPENVQLMMQSREILTQLRAQWYVKLVQEEEAKRLRVPRKRKRGLTAIDINDSSDSDSVSSDRAECFNEKLFLLGEVSSMLLSGATERDILIAIESK